MQTNATKTPAMISYEVLTDQIAKTPSLESILRKAYNAGMDAAEGYADKADYANKFPVIFQAGLQHGKYELGLIQ